MRTHRLRLFTLALSIVFTASCGSAPTEVSASARLDPAADLVQIQLAAREFPRGSMGHASVAFIVQNTGNRTVGVMHCGDEVRRIIQVLKRGTWQPYSGGHCLAVNLDIPVSLAPSDQLNGLTSVSDTGYYRLIITTDAGQVASTAFAVR